MKYLLFGTLTLLILVGWSCRGAKDSSTKDTSDLSKLTKAMEMYKSPCFGTCPVFRMTIYDNGFVAFNGIRNTDKQGLYVRQLSKKQYEKLSKAFEAADFWSHPDVYPSDVSDVPSITISQFREGKAKEVKGDFSRPEAILELEKMLDAVASEGEWTQREGPVKEERMVSKEIIVQFKGDTDIPTWVEGMAKYETQLLKQVAPNSPYWVITFNTQKISPERMLELVKGSEGVAGAQFNRKVELRDR
ncbi:MAG: DUF6438 domain-containing protein [Bacteroidota bacterium]